MKISCYIKQNTGSYYRIHIPPKIASRHLNDNFKVMEDLKGNIILFKSGNSLKFD